MGVTITNPFGSGSFTTPILIGGVRWDRGFSTGTDLLGQDLTAITRGGVPGAGTCVFPEVSQSSGTIYWEITWTALQSSALEGGIGVIALDALGAVSDFSAFAADGTGGCMIRPNGQVLTDGEVVGNINETSDQVEGDTVGLLLEFNNPFHPSSPTLTFLGVGGPSVAEASWQTGFFAIPSGSYMPIVAFGTVSVFDTYAATARFSQNDQDAFLGPSLFPSKLGDITLGWPNSA